MQHAQGANLIKIRLGQHENQKIRIVLDVSEPIQWSIQAQEAPDLLKLSLAADLSNVNLPKNSAIVKEIQLSEPLVLKFKKPVLVQKSFSIPPNTENGNYRIVLDVQLQNKPQDKPEELPQIPPLVPKIEPKLPPKIENLIPIKEDAGQKIIIIDAGHGGEDSGTVGYHNSREKDVTFKMAQVLKETIEANPKYKVVLTRDRDKFIRLRDRIKMARQQKGDLFMSLHADSHSSSDAQGLSVYTLSHVASDRDAARLAAKENKADLIMGVELEGESPEVANILIDLVKRETMNMSAKFAGALIQELGKRVTLLKNTHRFAAFYVLRAPDIPSVLIELGFLSNKEDEELLNSKSYRQKIADGIMKAVTVYFQQNGQ